METCVLRAREFIWGNGDRAKIRMGYATFMVRNRAMWRNSAVNIFKLGFVEILEAFF